MLRGGCFQSQCPQVKRSDESLFQDPDLFRKVGTADTPFGRIEIVAAAADIFHEAQGEGMVGNENIPGRDVAGELNTLFPEVCDGLFVSKCCLGKDFSAQNRTEGKGRMWDQIFALWGGHRQARRKDA